MKVYMQVSSKQEDVNIVEDQHKEEEKFLLAMPCITTNKLSKAWLINNDCTNHFTRYFFSNSKTKVLFLKS